MSFRAPPEHASRYVHLHSEEGQLLSRSIVHYNCLCINFFMYKFLREMWTIEYSFRSVLCSYISFVNFTTLDVNSVGFKL